MRATFNRTATKKAQEAGKGEQKFDVTFRSWRKGRKGFSVVTYTAVSRHSVKRLFAVAIEFGERFELI